VMLRSRGPGAPYCLPR